MRQTLALLAGILFVTTASAAEKPAAAATDKAATPAKPAAASTDDYVMLKVNNQDITASEIKRMWDNLFPPGTATDFNTLKPEMRDKILRGIMTEHLLLSEALKEGVDKSDAVQRQLEDIRKKLIVRAYIEAKTADISDKELHDAYDASVMSLRDQKEVRARHILVASKEDAVKVKKELTSGKSFEDVAKQYSKDPTSAKQGGDLGYFTKDKMVKEFADAAFTLKKGEVSDPVKSPFGWHIIEVEDIRPVTVPTYNEAKDQLKLQLQEKKLDDYLHGLLKTAEVKLYDAKGKEIPFSKDVPEPAKAKK